MGCIPVKRLLQDLARAFLLGYYTVAQICNMFHGFLVSCTTLQHKLLEWQSNCTVLDKHISDHLFLTASKKSWTHFQLIHNCIHLQVITQLTFLTRVVQTYHCYHLNYGYKDLIGWHPSVNGHKGNQQVFYTFKQTVVILFYKRNRQVQLLISVLQIPLWI